MEKEEGNWGDKEGVDEGKKKEEEEKEEEEKGKGEVNHWFFIRIPPPSYGDVSLILIYSPSSRWHAFEPGIAPSPIPRPLAFPSAPGYAWGKGMRENMYFKMASWKRQWMVRWEVGCETGFSQHDFWEEMPLCLRNALTQVQTAKLESHHCHIDRWTGQENAHVSKTLKGGLCKM